MKCPKPHQAKVEAKAAKTATDNPILPRVPTIANSGAAALGEGEGTVVWGVGVGVAEGVGANGVRSTLMSTFCPDRQ